MEIDTKYIDQIKDEIEDDLIGSYYKLLDFSHKYVNDYEIHLETILLGSTIYDSMNEYGDPLKNDEPQISHLKQQSLELVEKIKNNIDGEASTVYQRDKIKTRDYFLEEKPNAEIIFEGINISKTYSKSGFRLKNISLSLKLGEITGVVGENGNGKTTLLRIIAGDHSSDTGILKYPKFESSRKNNWVILKQNIGYISQDLKEWKSINTVKEHILFEAAIKGIDSKRIKNTVEHVINRLGLNKYEDRTWDELSGGFKLRFALAKVLVWKPKLLILDEPLSNLDVKAQAQFLSDLRNLTDSLKDPMAVLISSQNLHEVEKISDNLIFLKRGETIYNGSVNDIWKQFNTNCFEIESTCSLLKLRKTLKNLAVTQIKDFGFYFMITTARDVGGDDILETLQRQNVQINMFRDISNSTRLFFEK